LGIVSNVVVPKRAIVIPCEGTAELGIVISPKIDPQAHLGFSTYRW
jgi:hypothetical protein